MFVLKGQVKSISLEEFPEVQESKESIEAMRNVTCAIKPHASYTFTDSAVNDTTYYLLVNLGESKENKESDNQIITISKAELNTIRVPEEFHHIVSELLLSQKTFYFYFEKETELVIKKVSVS